MFELNESTLTLQPVHLLIFKSANAGGATRAEGTHLRSEERLENIQREKKKGGFKKNITKKTKNSCSGGPSLSGATAHPEAALQVLTSARSVSMRACGGHRERETGKH